MKTLKEFIKNKVSNKKAKIIKGGKNAIVIMDAEVV